MPIITIKIIRIDNLTSNLKIITGIKHPPLINKLISSVCETPRDSGPQALKTSTFQIIEALVRTSMHVVAQALITISSNSIRDITVMATMQEVETTKMPWSKHTVAWRKMKSLKV